MNRISLFILAAALLFCSCSSDSASLGEPCSDDGDCGGTLLCCDGVCQNGCNPAGDVDFEPPDGDSKTDEDPDSAVDGDLDADEEQGDSDKENADTTEADAEFDIFEFDVELDSTDDEERERDAESDSELEGEVELERTEAVDVEAETDPDAEIEFELEADVEPDTEPDVEADAEFDVEADIEAPRLFNAYILAAVEYAYTNYGLLGYDAAELTHDIAYGPHGLIYATGGSRTMSVSAMMEVILTALQLYSADTGDQSVWEYLPKSSWENMEDTDIKSWLWVNYDLGSAGTADALEAFGMGEHCPFEQLQPGSFINFNRTSGSGHAVVFLGFVDEEGAIFDTYSDDVIGFYYFSAQGSYEVGLGGLDYRYGLFSDALPYPDMPYKRDLNIIRSENQQVLSTGVMLHPAYWSASLSGR